MNKSNDDFLKIDLIPSENITDKKAQQLHKKLIKPPFVFLLVGSAGTGKSSLIWTMLSKWYKPYFDLLVIYNGVKDADDTYNSLADKKTTVLLRNEWDAQQFENFLNVLEDEQQKLREEGKRIRHVCLVFDDFITQNIMKASHVSILDRAVANRRHYGLSIILSTQSYKWVNRSFRCLNCSGIFLTGVNKDDLKMIAEEHATAEHTPNDIIKKYGKTMDKPYSVFVIDYKDHFKNRFKNKTFDVIE
jgi:DNA replication protein DnaC